MTNVSALLLTLLSGFFFVFGFFIVKFVKAKKEMSILSISLAFVIMLGMLLFDLIPEIIELTENINGTREIKILWVLFFLGLGIVILKLFDKFLPHHHHEHHEEELNMKEHNGHMFHIGFILAISLILHNILEGMSMFIIALESWSSGLVLALGVGLHNLPLGIEIASNMQLSQENRKLTLWMFFALTISTFLGGCLIFFINTQLSDFVLFAFICIACGMIIYITLFELLKEIFNYKNSKYTYVGITLGLIILFLMTFLE